jgi:SAM-dependent methyltransferase
MGASGESESRHDHADPSTVTVFQQDWQIYQKMVENNFVFHREVYSRLRTFLFEEVARPFDFLDIGCGDASTCVGALEGTQVAHYYGIDFSAVALDLARTACVRLPCPVSLEQGDFAELVLARTDPVDVAWVGLCLHHLRNSEKLAFMRGIHHILRVRGVLLIYENTSLDGEDREGWLRQWDLQKPLWTAYNEAEWNAMTTHVHAADFPETDAGWHALGRDSGFNVVRELFAAPSNLFRMYSFAA